MTSQHDKPKRWRPKFSVRTLVIVVTLVCCYLGAWEATKTWGIPAIPVSAYQASELTSPCPFVIVNPEDSSNKIADSFNEIAKLLGGPVGATGEKQREVYFWFFGYIAKLPYERADALPTLLISETGSWDRRAEQSSDVIDGGARSE